MAARKDQVLTTLTEEFYEHREQAATAAAARIASLVESALDRAPEASLVVTGGSTPQPVYERLAQATLDWDRVTVTLSDERWVPADDPESNERLVRRSLMGNGAKAAAATLLPLYSRGKNPEAACRELEGRFDALPLPFAVTFLGMGADGHFASLFPDYDGLAAALATDGERRFVPVATAASPHPRLSMTLSALTRSEQIVLLIFGEAKRRVYEDAKAGSSALPVATLLARSRAPVRVIWAP